MCSDTGMVERLERLYPAVVLSLLVVSARLNITFLCLTPVRMPDLFGGTIDEPFSMDE